MSEASKTAETTEQASVGKTQYVRVAVVQMEYHPAIKIDARSAIEDPGGVAFLFPPNDTLPEVLWESFAKLQGRIRNQYNRYMARKVKRILQQCDLWGVRVVVFPEYSIPWQILPEVAKVAANIVVVAGTHTVDKDSKHVYEQLGWPKENAPKLAQSVAPVLFDGKLLGLSGKFHPAVAVGEKIVPAKTWQTIPMPPGIPGPMGVMVCLDFLHRENQEHRTLVGDQLDKCHFLAVPSLTPSRSLDRFENKGWDEVKGYGRPVIYTNDSKEGGATIFVDEKERSELNPFPEHVGQFVAKEEGVIVADVDLGFKRAGGSGRLDGRAPVQPFAMASLVYRARPAENAYSGWLDGLRSILGDAIDDLDDEQVEQIHGHVRTSRGILVDVGTRSTARTERLRKLRARLENITFVEDIRRLTREVELEPQVLPFGAFCAAMAKGAADVFDAWARKRGDLGVVRDELATGWEKIVESSRELGDDAKVEAKIIRNDVAGSIEKRLEISGGRIFVVPETDIFEDFGDKNKIAEAMVIAGQFESAREEYRKLSKRAAKLIDVAHDSGQEINSQLLRWVARFNLMSAHVTLSLQDRQTAHDALLDIDSTHLSVGDKIQLAQELAMVDELDRAKQVFPDEADVGEQLRMHWSQARQMLQIADGIIPKDLSDDPILWAHAADAFYVRHDHARAARYAQRALENAHDDVFTGMKATIVLWNALQGTALDEAPDVNRIPTENRAKVIELLEKAFASFKGKSISSPSQKLIVTCEKLFRVLMQDASGTSLVDDDEADLEAWESKQKDAFRLAREGSIEDALALLGPSTNPWLGELNRINFMLHANQLDEAWELARKLVERWENRPLLDWKFANLCLQKGMRNEALPHAERAFAALPGIGYRLLLAQLRAETGDDRGAWALLDKLVDDERAEVHHWRGLVAHKLGKFDEATASHRRYLIKRPDDSSMQLNLATSLLASNKVEEAAAVAWKAFEKRGSELEPQHLYQCGWIQGAAGLHERERTRRIRMVAEKLAIRFPNDVAAERYRCLLHQELPRLPDEAAADVQKWAELGFVRQLTKDEAQRQRDKELEKNNQLSMLAHLGHLPAMVAARDADVGPAMVIARLLDRSRTATAEGHLSPPVPLVEHAVPISLTNARILLSDLEFSIVAALELDELLGEALGPHGRLILFEDARNHLLMDAASLRSRKNRLNTSAPDRVALEYAERAILLSQRTFVEIEKAPDQLDLPPTQANAPDLANSALRPALIAALTYREALRTHSDWRLLTADFFVTLALRNAGTVNFLKWSTKEEFDAIASRILSSAHRDLTLPTFIRLLIPNGQEAQPYLRKLAELGFPDALDDADILRLERHYQGLQSDVPKRILDAQEWMAREPKHLGGEFARLRFAKVYAKVITTAFFELGRTQAEKIAIIDSLLGRVESIAFVTSTNVLDAVFIELAVMTINRQQHVWQEDPHERGRFRVRADNPIERLWQDLTSWAGKDGSRRAALGRAFRQVWRMISSQPQMLHSLTIATLTLIHIQSENDGKREWSFMEPGIEALTILSAFWIENPLSNTDGGKILNETVKLFGSAPLSNQSGREFFYQAHLPGQTAPVTIRVPIEALFLRISNEQRKPWIKPLQYMQGVYDGEAYQLLKAIENEPENDEHLRRYANNAVGALFRLVQDDPAVLGSWGTEFTHFNAKTPQPFGELLTVLSEPPAPLDDDKPICHLIHERMGLPEGFWHDRLDSDRLLKMATEIPGVLATQSLPWKFFDHEYSSNIESALDHIDHPDEHPVGRLAADMFFLRAAAVFRPLVRITATDIDLRDELPARFHKLLAHVIDEPKPDTVGTFEPALLQCCSATIQRLAGPQLTIKWGVWLTWRLFQWLWLQLESISPDARLSGMQRLATNVPQFGAPDDRLDPAGFGRNKFDHRLAAVLHSLGEMDVATMFAQEAVEEVLKASETPIFNGSIRNISSPEIEQLLLSLAQQVSLEPSLTSKLDWNAPGTVPELALFALLGMNPTRFVDLSVETRTRYLEKLPQDLEALIQLNGGDAELAQRIVFAAANGAGKLTPDERQLLESKIVQMKTAPQVEQWQAYVFVCLYATGAEHLEQRAWDAMYEQLGKDHLQNSLALVSRLLLGTADRDPEQLESKLSEVFEAATKRGVDAGALIAGGLARVVGAGKPGSKKMGRTLLAKLANHPELGNHPSMREVRGFFGIKGETS